MTTLTRLNSDMGDILLTNLNTPAQDCTVTIPVVSGKSAYDLAVENGYVGSLQDWLASLSGWQPIDSDFANYLEQHLQLSSLFNGVNSKIEANKAELDARIEERISEANAITTQLQNEAEARVVETKQLSQGLLDEAKNRINAIGQLANNIQSESLIRTSEIEQLHADIQFEQVNRVAEITTIKNITIDQNMSIASITRELTAVGETLETKASASVLEDVVSKVRTVNGEVEAHSAKLVQLTNDIEGKANSSALQSLSNTVSEVDGKVTINSHAITALKGSVTAIEGNLTKKADASVLVDYYKQVDADQAIAGKISEFKTNYVLPELGKKFDASAISSYYNKSDTESAITSKIDSFKANYVDSELNKKFNASAISDYYTIAKANEAITNKIDTFKSTLEVGGRNLALNTGAVSTYFYGVDTKEPLIQGETYTFSFDYKGTPVGNIFLNNSTSGTISSKDYSSTWKRAFVTFVFNKNDYNGKEIYPHVYGVDNLRYQKLERGNIATDWTAAPEDIEANITNNYYTKVQANEAIASQTSDIRTTIGNHTTSIQQHSESINGIKANWALKLNANGRVSGMTLMNDGTTSEFAIEADNFYVGAIGSSYKPFQVKTVGWTGVDGRSYPSGVYINNAIIGDLDAKVIRAGTITGDKIKAGSITGDKIEAGSITADRIQIGSLGRDKLDNTFVSTVDTAYSMSSNVSTAVKNISNWDGVSNTLTISRNNISGGKDLANLWTNQFFDPKFPQFATAFINEGKLGEHNGSCLIDLRARHNIGHWDTRFYVKPGEQYVISCIGFNYSGVGFYVGLWVTTETGEDSTYPPYTGFVNLQIVGETGGGWKLLEAVFTVHPGYNPSIPLVGRLHFFQDTFDFNGANCKVSNVVIKKVIKESGVDPQLVDRSKQAKQLVDDIVSDNKITPDEKQGLLITFKQITNDNDMWRNQAYLIGLEYTRQWNATTALLSTNRPYLGWVCRSDALTQTDTLNAGERTTLMNAITEYHAANQDLAMRVGSYLRTTANTANGIAAGARDLLNRWKANGNGTLYIDDNHIAVNKIGANEIAAGAITADHIYGGTITGDKLKASTITSDKIDTRGLSIKDASGNVLFGSGTALNVANIAGLGSFATVNKLTTSNISTYVDGLGVKNLLVGDAQITSANIGTAQIDTLQIAGEAVIVPRAQYNPNELAVKGNGDQVKLFSISLDTIGNVVSIASGFERIYGDFSIAGSSNATFTFYVKLYRNGIEIKSYKINFTKIGGDTLSTRYSIDAQLLAIPTFLDTPPSGTNVYEMYVNWGTSSSTVKNESIRVVGASVQLLGVKR